MIRFVLPAEHASWEERVAFACLPLADCVLALTLVANGIPSGGAAGAARRADLEAALTSAQRRSIADLFGAAFPIGALAFAVARTLPDSTDPTQFIAAIRALPDMAVVRQALICGGDLRADAPQSPGALRSLTDDPDWAAEYVRHFLLPAPADPARLVDAVTHPARVRQRIAELLADLFAGHFAPLLPILLAAERAAEERMCAAYDRDPAAFIALHVPGGADQCLFWPSVYLGAGWAVIPGGDAGLIAYGVETAVKAPRSEPIEPGAIVPEVAPAATYQDVYRLLADPVRWSLIQLLVAAPRYGQELSELLGLSIATISHHLNGLKRLELVDIQRDEHRLYYHLRTDRLRALLAGAEQRLLMR